MEQVDAEMLASWKRALGENQKLLAAHGAGRAPNYLQPGTVQMLADENDRLKGLIGAYEAALAAGEGPGRDP